MAEGEEPKERKVDGLVNLETDNFLRGFIELMRPLHKMTSREMDYAAAMLKVREEIAKEVTDQNKIDKLLFDDEVREFIRKEAKVKPDYAKALIYGMRRKGFIVGKRINPMYIPSWEKGKPFRLMFVIKTKDENK